MDELEAAEANEEAWGRAQEIRAQIVALQEVERQVDGLLNRDGTDSPDDNWNEPKRLPDTLPGTLPSTLPGTLPMIENGLIRGECAEEKNVAQTPCQNLDSSHAGSPPQNRDGGSMSQNPNTAAARAPLPDSGRWPRSDGPPSAAR